VCLCVCVFVVAVVAVIVVAVGAVAKHLLVAALYCLLMSFF
jgi:hypothetical protein